MTESNKRTLVLAILEIRSSYVEGRREPAERETPDTEQWWIGPEATWRIRTFGIDHDLHLFHVRGGDADTFAKLTLQEFDGVVRAVYRLEFGDYTDVAERERVLREAGLHSGLEVADEHGFAFWNPDREVYKTKSYPEE